MAEASGDPNLLCHSDVDDSTILLPVKRPLDYSKSSQASVKKSKLSSYDDGDDIPFSSLVKKTAESADKSLSMLKKFIHKELGLVVKSVVECQRKRQVTEQTLHSLERDIDECQRKMQVEEQRLHFLERDIEECTNELENKRKQVSNARKINEVYKKMQIKIEECVLEFVTKETLHSLMEDLVRERELQLKTKEVEIHQVMHNMNKEQQGKEEELEVLFQKVVQCTKELKTKEEELDSINKLIDGQAKELESERKKLLKVISTRTVQMKDFESMKKQLESRTKELDSEKKNVEGRVKEFNLKEEEFEGRVKEFNLQEEEFERKAKEFNLKEEEFEREVKEFNLKEEEFEREVKEFNLKEDEFEGRVKEFNLKEEEFEQQVKEVKLNFGSQEKYIESKRNQLEGQLEELKSKEKQLKDQEKELVSKHKHFDILEKELNSEKKQLEGEVKEFDSKEKKFKGQVKEFESKEEQLLEKVKDVESKKKHYESLIKEVKSKEKQVDGRLKELESKKNQLEDRVKEFELKKVEFESQVKELGSKERREKQSEVLIKSLKEENELDEPESNGNDVLAHLKATPDPSKTVLDIIKKPIVPQFKNEDGAVIMDRHIFLLEQLLRISPHIKPGVRGEAMELALDLKDKIRTSSKNSLEVLGFLLVLSIYGLVPLFDEEEVLKLLEFAGKCSDFVQNLVKKRLYIEAVRFICAFKLADKNQPVDLLRKYMQDKARDQEIASLTNVLLCISDHNLESEGLLNEIQDCIIELNRQKGTSVSSGTWVILKMCNNLRKRNMVKKTR